MKKKNINGSAKNTKQFVILDKSVYYAVGLKKILCTELIDFNATVEIAPNQDNLAEPTTRTTSRNPPTVLIHLEREINLADLKLKLQTVRKSYRGTKVVIYSSVYSPELLFAVLHFRSIRGYFLLSEKPDKIIPVIQSVLNGNVALSELVMTNYLAQKQKDNSAKDVRNINWRLTEKERATLHLIASDAPVAYILKEASIDATRWTNFLTGLSKKIKEPL